MIYLTKEQVVEILTRNGYIIKNSERTGNDLGTKLVLSNGCIVNCWDCHIFLWTFL